VIDSQGRQSMMSFMFDLSRLTVVDPASGTASIGAFVRLTYPDLTRLFDVDSLNPHQLVVLAEQED
jgi:hypothetical protein